MKRFLCPLILLSGVSAYAAEAPDWREGAVITAPRSNPYSLEPSEFSRSQAAGRTYALEYPVNVSGAVIPWNPLKEFLDQPSRNPIRLILQSAFKSFSNIKSTDDLFARVGLHTYPTTEAEGSKEIPRTRSSTENVRMGVTLTRKNSIEVMTLSCAICHSSNLFGKKVLGLTNRFPGANDFFVLGKKAVSLVPSSLFATTLGVTPEEQKEYARFRTRLRSVGARHPTTIGLDTSLAQVALSLAHRSDDEFASFDRNRERHPKAEILSTFVADSKPAVWWNLKYKNKWLSDGSVVSGNPIYTNFLWNEIGRGTDLHELESWFDENQETIRDLTTATFSTEAPRITDFFPAQAIQIERAKRGEVLFNQACSKCHGTYVKTWSLPGTENLPAVELLKTTEVRYFKDTPIINVGTDPNRRLGMTSLEKGLNPLAISKKNGIVIRTQKGYVPPPLVGIWARFPYFHNNSAPNLCAVLTRTSDRPKTYWSGEALDQNTDFDSECVGYPTGERVPSAWKDKAEHLYDTSKAGLANTGHDERIFLKDGVEIFNHDQKLEIIEFLKTL